MYSETPGFEWLNACSRIPSQRNILQCCCVRSRDAPVLLLSFGLHYCLWEFSYFTFLPKDQVWMYRGCWFYFSPLLSVFACIPKNDTKIVACENRKQSVCKLKWHNLDIKFLLSAILKINSSFKLILLPKDRF